MTKTSSKTFIEQARRQQIVECAIDILAERGYAQTSLSRIAERAAISKGVISYHFASKAELLASVVAEVFEEFSGFVHARLEGVDGVVSTLRAFFEANMQFIDGHRKHMLAMFEVLEHAGDEVQPLGTRESDLRGLQQLLEEGQCSKELREFDAGTMAATLLSLRDGVLHQLSREPELDVVAHGREIVALVERGLRRER